MPSRSVIADGLRSGIAFRSEAAPEQYQSELPLVARGPPGQSSLL
jgi:hypothetical protein